MSEPGLFITIEGGEGVGKSTLAEGLCKLFKENGEKAIVTHEPGGTDFAQSIRKLLLEQSHDEGWPVDVLLVNAARISHWKKVIQPAIEKGIHVICDRFIDSTRVYQGLVQEDSEQACEAVDALHDMFFWGCEPEITFVLDLDPSEGLKRLKKRGEKLSKQDMEPLPFHQAVREGFLHLARQGEPYSVIDASLSPEEVLEECWDVLSDEIF